MYLKGIFSHCFCVSINALMMTLSCTIAIGTGDPGDNTNIEKNAGVS